MSVNPSGLVTGFEMCKKITALGSVASVSCFLGMAGWEDRFSSELVSLCRSMTCFDEMCSGMLSACLVPQKSTPKLLGKPVSPQESVWAWEKERVELFEGTTQV